MTEPQPSDAGPLVVVFDTNVLIPLCLPSGRSQSTRLLSRLQKAGAAVRFSTPMLDEVREKMRRKKTLRRWLQLSGEEIEQFVHDIPAILGHDPLSGKVAVTGVVKSDPKDDMIIAAAVEAKASYLVTEDRHLLELKDYQGIKIMTRKEFSQELDQLGIP